MRRLKKNVKKKLIVILIGLVTLCAAGYLVLCFMAGTGDFISHTTINGIDVGDMTQEEASLALNQKFKDDTQDLVLTFKAHEKTYAIDLKDNVIFDADKAVQEVIDETEGFFLARGYHYLRNHDFTAPVHIKDEDVLKKSIGKSDILTYDTTVKTTYELADKDIIFTKGKDGQKVTEENTIQQINKALKDYDFKREIECDLFDNRLEDGEMEALHKELCQEAKNATLDKKNNYQIVDSKVGIDYDLKAAKDAFSKAAPGEQFKVNAQITQPKISKENLEKNLFREVMGSYSTYVSGTAARKNNVRLAAERCNTILLPGEEFSFNGTVGKRTVEKGFGAAGAYVNGETVDTVGGGICQTSSTLYNAVLLSNLQITLRSNHSYVSSYVPIGRDATVSWGGPDFKFKNNTDYPIKIVMSYSNSRVYAKVYGTNIDGIKVKITSEKLSSTPFTTKYVNDPTLEVGKTKTQVSGYTGAKAQSYRHVYDKNGKLISSTKEAYSNYKKRDKVVLVGTKPVATPPPSEPTTPTEQTPTPAQ